jgi:hypothetical protein
LPRRGPLLKGWLSRPTLNITEAIMISSSQLVTRHRGSLPRVFKPTRPDGGRRSSLPLRHEIRSLLDCPHHIWSSWLRYEMRGLGIIEALSASPMDRLIMKNASAKRRPVVGSYF